MTQRLVMMFPLKCVYKQYCGSRHQAARLLSIHQSPFVGDVMP